MLRFDLTNFSFVINFEYVAFLIMIIVLVYMFIGRLITLRRSKIFTIIIAVCISFTILNMFKVRMINMIIAGQMDKNFIGLVNTLNTSYFLLILSSFFGYSIYTSEITCGVRYFKARRFRGFIFYIPAFVMVGIIIANYFSTVFMSFEVTNAVYLVVNLPFLITIIVIGYGYLLFSSYLVLKFRMLFEKRQVISMSLILPIMIGGLLIEIFSLSYFVLSFAVALCIILVQTILESSEDLIDETTQLFNLAEFIKQINKAYITKDKIGVVLINTKNYSELVNTYNFTEVAKYNLSVTEILRRLKKELKIKDEMYSLNNGYYASVTALEDFDLNYVDVFGRAILEREGCEDFIPDLECCFIDLTKDFDNPDDVINFASNFRHSISFKRRFTKYSDVKNDKNLIITNNLEQIIDTGLKEKEFEVYYQPIYSTRYKKFKTAEALVRLNSKKYGFISPGAFIPYAEKTGRINDIDNFVMEEVFKFVSSSIFTVLGLDYIEVNLSMAECVDPMLVERIRELMERYSVDPKNINLEITESFNTSEQRIINENLQKLVEMGFKFSLDDYGTGYSNINRFSSLPISIVKIDKSLVDESEDSNIQKILEYSFNIVKDLEKETVIEGVETKEQLDRFIEYGATYIQGYYFSKPLDYDSYINFIEKNNA